MFEPSCAAEPARFAAACCPAISRVRTLCPSIQSLAAGSARAGSADATLMTIAAKAAMTALATPRRPGCTTPGCTTDVLAICFTIVLTTGFILLAAAPSCLSDAPVRRSIAEYPRSPTFTSMCALWPSDREICLMLVILTWDSIPLARSQLLRALDSRLHITGLSALV